MMLLDARIFDPAARQKSLAWYATGQRTQRISRPKNKRSRKTRERQKKKGLNIKTMWVIQVYLLALGKCHKQMEALLDQETLNTQFPKRSSDGNYMINGLKESDPTTVSESTSTRISLTQTTVLTGKRNQLQTKQWGWGWGVVCVYNQIRRPDGRNTH